MKTKITSLLVPAALVLVVVGLAVWVVSQLAGSQAAAERLPPIVVGRVAAEPSEGPGSQPADGSPTDTGPAGSPTPAGRVGTATTGDVPGTARTTSPTPGTSATTGTTSPGTTSIATTMRMVVPDPVREYMQNGGGGSTPDTGATLGMTGTSGMMGR